MVERRRQRHRGGGALSGPEILEAIERHTDPLVVMPGLFDAASLANANSLDLRLGHEFIAMRKAELSTLRLAGDRRETSRNLRRFYETTYVGFESEFVLHPGELVLGATLEYIKLPCDILAYILGRSSWGRLGLIIATATVIHPGYKGCPTLELANTGNIPIELFPGSPVPIAQLTLHGVGPGQSGYAGRYSERQWVGPTGPGYSRIHTDAIFERWAIYRSRRGRPPEPGAGG